LGVGREEKIKLGVGGGNHEKWVQKKESGSRIQDFLWLQEKKTLSKRMGKEKESTRNADRKEKTFCVLEES